MTKHEQQDLLKRILNGIETRLLQRSDQWADDWNGLELRWLILHAVEEETRPISKRSWMWKAFRNYWRTRNLY